MFDALRYRLAYRAAVRAARERDTARTAGPDGKVLVLLPREDEALRAAWRFVQGLDLPRRALVLATAAERIAYTPDAFAAGVTMLGEQERDWRGLPRPAVTRRVWKARTEVALDLSTSFDLASAYLVGASPGAFRIGLYSEEAEPFFDFMIAPTGGYEAALQALRGYLAAVEPPLHVFQP